MDIKIRLVIFLILLMSFTYGQTRCVDEVQKLYNQGKYTEGIELSSSEINKLKSTDTLYGKTVRLRAVCFMALSNFKSAVEDYKTLISLGSKDISDYTSIAFAYWAIGDDANCLTSINKAHQIDPDNAFLLSKMSYYYSQNNMFEESLKFANIGLEQKDVSNTIKGLLLNNRGYAFIGLKQYDKAIEDINHSIKLNPNNSFAYLYRALVNIELKKMNTVCQDLEKAKSLGGENLTHDYIVKYCK